MFSPEHKFIKHSDQEHEKSLQIKKFDLEYPKKFTDFFLSLFKKVNIDASNNLKSYFQFRDYENGSAYLDSTSYLSRALTSSNPSQRLVLDEKLEEEFEGYHLKMSTDEIARLDEIITKAYLKKVDIKKLISLMEVETDQVKKNLLLLIIQIINPNAIPKTENEVKIKMAYGVPYVGDCSKAERHMLSYISGRHPNPRHGYVNLILDNKGSPLMLEKIDLGNSHSCISLKPVRINRVLIPAGAIFAAKPENKPIRSTVRWFTTQKRAGAINFVTGLNHYRGFEFIRMSLISIPEEIRASAGGSYYLDQQYLTEGYINYDWLTPEIIAEYAMTRLEKK